MRIDVGSVVVATRDGGHDSHGLPMQRPVAGKTYRITSVYRMGYGLGCTLWGMDPSPYRGYFLFTRKASRSYPAGWWFKPLEVADQEFTATLFDYLRSKRHENA